MSWLLYGQDQEKQELIAMHEAKAMVCASTEFGQCMHA